MWSDDLDDKLIRIESTTKENWEYMYKLTDHLQRQIDDIKITLKHIVK